MIGSYHLNVRTAVFVVLCFFMHLDIFRCTNVEIVEKYFRDTCFSKPNVIKDNKKCVGKPSCSRNFSKIKACWDKTCAGEKATTPCPMMFFRTNASLEAFCDSTGNWIFPKTSLVIKKCTRLTNKEMEELFDPLLQKKVSSTERYQAKVYETFSWICLSFMIPSLFILFYFMDRKNIRFNLHKNLICAFLFRTVTFFIDVYGAPSGVVCNLVWVLNRFFALSEVTWMLNEALFLLKLLFRTFDAKSYFWGFFIFGWGFPAIVVFGVYVPFMVEYFGQEMCWTDQKDSYYMFIIYGPMTLMLLINFVTLIYVIYVLLDKLRTSTTSELLRLKKGIKAALILMPLLGVIYLMILYVPKTAPKWYQYLIRILYPMQGTLACLVYVVFNGEVRQAVKTRWHRWLHTKSEFLERRHEVTNFLSGADVLNGHRINDGDIVKRTTIVQADTRGFITSHVKELPYAKSRDKMKPNISPTTPLSSDGGDQEKPLFPKGHKR